MRDVVNLEYVDNLDGDDVLLVNVSKFEVEFEATSLFGTCISREDAVHLAKQILSKCEVSP